MYVNDYLVKAQHDDLTRAQPSPAGPPGSGGRAVGNVTA